MIVKVIFVAGDGPIGPAAPVLCSETSGLPPGPEITLHSSRYSPCHEADSSRIPYPIPQTP